MSRARFLSLCLRQFGLTLAALCLMLQAAVPSGFMLAASEGGFPLSVVICGDAGRTVASSELGVDQDGGEPADDGETSPCIFAGFNAGATAPDLPVLEHASAAYTPAPFPNPAFRSPATHTAAAPPPSRGPPSLV